MVRNITSTQNQVYVFENAYENLRQEMSTIFGSFRKHFVILNFY